MAILLMLGWWYGRGWLWVLGATRRRLHSISTMFAVRVLLRTWFSPWKQVHKQSTFSTFLRDAADNAVSRGVGAVVRGTILFWAFILSVVVLFGGLLSLLLWPVIPLLVILLPALSLSGVAL